MHYTLFGFLKMKLRGEERRGEERSEKIGFFYQTVPYFVNYSRSAPF
jgi:hypothetical protein